MSLTKKYLKSKPICKVTFKVPKKAVNGAKKVQVVGDFNEWNPKKTIMKKLKDGSFTLTMELDKGNEYQFRYLIDGKKWENDWKADGYVPNGYGAEENSVVIV
ncbi:MAG: isoamylase early set domain-containing protein [Saprospiraceae bacterium]|nr:isoamylase early set domain-containing protein [Saprospiraceae bacterium]